MKEKQLDEKIDENKNKIGKNIEKQDLSNPDSLSIEFIQNLANDSNNKFWNDNTFIVFKSYNEIIYVIYANRCKSIIALDLINNQIINEIKNAHNGFIITNFRHYFDKISKRDLVISLSKDNNNLKVWNINNFECILNMVKVYEQGCLSSACFLNDNNIFILMCNYDSAKNEKTYIKLYDLNGKKKKKIKDSNYDAIFIDTYFDKKLSKLFIISGNKGCFISYDYSENKKYFIYKENNQDNYKDNYFKSSIIIDDNKGLTKLIGSSCGGFIGIWNFHLGDLLNKIIIGNLWLYSICLWKEKYLFVGSQDSSIKLIDLDKKIIIKDIKGHKNMVLTIKKINHPKYGECLMSQSAELGIIKLWKISI